MTIFEFNERKKNVVAGWSLYFTVAEPSGTGANRFFSGSNPFASGDIKISLDGGSFVNTTNLPTGNGPVFALALPQAETNADTIIITIVDQDGPAYRDAMLVVRTKQEIQTLDIAGNHQIGGNLAITGNHAIGGDLDVTGSIDVETNLDVAGDVLVGDDVAVTGDISAANLTISGAFTAGAIAGILTSMTLASGTAAAGGASSITLANTAVAVADYYNGALVFISSGTGVGQARLITDYSAGRVATVNTPWIQNPSTDSVYVIVPFADAWLSSPSAELASMPTGTSPFGQLLQFLFNRFAYKRTQTSNLFTLFNNDSPTPAAQFQAGTTDDGSTQTFGQVEEV